MNSNDLKNAISGAIVVDKPTGMTSHDVVQAIRMGTGLKRVGHTGTLDPRASGVLVVLLGPAVRLSEYVSASDKRYQAIIRLGAATDTYDAEGKFTHESDLPVNITEEQFNTVLQKYVGEIEQTPPPYSAIKVQGRRAYDMARAGEEVELASRLIKVYHLEVLEWAPPEAVVDVHCSSGTYIRSLAHDLGKELGFGGYLTGLRRTKNGRFSLGDAVPLSKLREAFITNTWHQYVIPAAEALADMVSVELSEAQVESVKHGHRLPAPEDLKPTEDGLVRAISMQGELVALMQYDEATRELQPKKVFFQ